MKRLDQGVTLLELLIVLMIIGILATAAVRTWDITLDRTRVEETLRELEEIGYAISGDERLVIQGTRVDFGFVGDCGMLPGSLTDLAIKPPEIDTAVWRGPYVKPAFAENPRAFLTDAWGDSYRYYPESLIIRSYGGGGEVGYRRWLTKKLGFSPSELLGNSVQGTVFDAFGMSPNPAQCSLTTIYLFHPRNGRLRADSLILEPVYGGRFVFSDVACGKKRLVAVYRGTTPFDSVEKVITVYPRIGAPNLEIRFSKAIF